MFSFSKVKKAYILYILLHILLHIITYIIITFIVICVRPSIQGLFIALEDSRLETNKFKISWNQGETRVQQCSVNCCLNLLIIELIRMYLSQRVIRSCLPSTRIGDLDCFSDFLNKIKQSARPTNRQKMDLESFHRSDKNWLCD